MLTFIRSFLRDEEGQAMVEYALIIALIAIAVIVVIGVASGSIQAIFTRIAQALNLN